MLISAGSNVSLVLQRMTGVGFFHRNKFSLPTDPPFCAACFLSKLKRRAPSRSTGGKPPPDMQIRKGDLQHGACVSVSINMSLLYRVVYQTLLGRNHPRISTMVAPFLLIMLPPTSILSIKSRYVLRKSSKPRLPLNASRMPVVLSYHLFALITCLLIPRNSSLTWPQRSGSFTIRCRSTPPEWCCRTSHSNCHPVGTFHALISSPSLA
jgi:hypothetical protein